MSAEAALPAILGGEPLRPQGPPEWPCPDEAVLDAMRCAYADGSWGRYHGGNVERLERHLAAAWSVEHALTCGSGTFAVELGLRTLGVAAGDEVALAAYDYGGNFLSVHAIGAHPVLAEVDAENWNLDPHALEAVLTSSTRAIVVSHLHGGLVSMRDVLRVARQRGVPVLEDAAQAPGARVQGRPAGAWGDVGVLSFGGSKLLTAGRGGALLTSDAALAQRARLLLQRGNHVCPLSELQAAVLLPQLKLLDERNRRRSRSVGLLCDRLRSLPGIRPFCNRVSEDNEPAYYKLGFQYDADVWGISRERFIASLRAEGIAFDEGFRALHAGRSPRRWRSAGPLLQAERAHRSAVVLHHPILLGTDDDVEQVADALTKIHRHADKLR